MNCQLVQTAFRPKRFRVAVVASAVQSSQTVALLKERQPDVAIISSQLHEGPLEGFRVLRELRALQTRTRAVMLLASRERDLVIDAFRCGAHGVIFRDEPLETLSKCIHAVHQGQVWANSEHLGYLLDALGHTNPSTCRMHAAALLFSVRKPWRACSRRADDCQISSDLGLSNIRAQLSLSHFRQARRFDARRAGAVLLAGSAGGAG